jgi:hypothetical protein
MAVDRLLLQGLFDAAGALRQMQSFARDVIPAVT